MKENKINIINFQTQEYLYTLDYNFANIHLSYDNENIFVDWENLYFVNGKIFEKKSKMFYLDFSP
jgi:hypothetical protein